MYMENYSRRENLKFFGLPENIDASLNSMNVEEGLPHQHDASENTKEIIYKFLEDKLKIDRSREKIEFQRVHRLGKPNPQKSCPIIARFLRYSDRELVMEQARKHLKDSETLHEGTVRSQERANAEIERSSTERPHGLFQQSTSG